METEAYDLNNALARTAMAQQHCQSRLGTLELRMHDKSSSRKQITASESAIRESAVPNNIYFSGNEGRSFIVREFHFNRKT